jgi:hypothetical protein
VVVEQIPTKLATDILKNTSLKIMHRIVAADDREIMGATMNLDPDQVRRVGSLKVGDAAVFSQNDDKATLVNVPYRKLAAGTLSKNQENENIRRLMGSRFDESNDQSQRFAKAKGFTRWKRTAEDIAEKPEFRQSISRYILSTVATAAALWQDFEPLVQTISQHSRPGNNSAEFVAYTLYCAISHFFDVQGREYGWSYKDVAALTDNFYGLTYKVLLTTYGRGNDRPEMNVGQIEAFQAKYLALCQTPRLPFASCAQVCPINECVYRHNVRPLLADTRLNRGWENAAQSGDNEIWRRTGDVCQRAALKIVSRSTSATEQRKAAACYAIQKSASHPDYDAVLQNKIITNLIRVLQDQLT